MKKIIRKIIGYFGYDFIKIMPTPTGKEKTVKVGNYNIVLPSFNPLIVTYWNNPEMAFEISRIIRQTLEKYPRLNVLDIGANTGDTVALIKSVADIPVVSVEGDDISFSYLTRNTRQFKEVKILNQFLGEKPGKIKAVLDKKGWNTTIVPSENADTFIEIDTLDSVLQKNNIPIADLKLFKVDTEGFDTIIMRGAWNYIRTVHPVIYLEFNWDNMNAIGENGLKTIFDLKDEGYSKVIFFDDRGRYIITTDLDNRHVIESLSSYADGKSGLIYYYNICVLHKEDEDLAEAITAGERNLLNKN
jgi:FkbM family methyltransferase